MPDNYTTKQFHVRLHAAFYLRLLDRPPLTDVPTKRRFFTVGGASSCCPLWEEGDAFSAVPVDELLPSMTPGSARHTLKCS